MPFLVFFIGFTLIAVMQLMLGSARPFLVQYTHAFVYSIDHVLISHVPKVRHCLMYILCLVVLCDDQLYKYTITHYTYLNYYTH